MKTTDIHQLIARGFFDPAPGLVKDRKLAAIAEAKPTTMGGAEAKPLKIATDVTPAEERDIQEAARDGLARNIDRAAGLIALANAFDALADAGHGEAAWYLWNRRDELVGGK